ncbi:hypothetical protein BBJ28_00009660 [Nothophytophthora sp. Chile5]|nr:hypothetical protein BBJ28_00009660 [Nothophytophthora sp. Chile5]
MLFQADARTASSSHYQQQHSAPRPAILCDYTSPVHSSGDTTINQALSDDDMLDEIFQDIMSPEPEDPGLFATNSPSRGFMLLNSAHHFKSTTSTPTTPQLTQRTGTVPPMTLGSISPNMAAAVRVPTYPTTNLSGARNMAFFPLTNDPKSRTYTGLNGFSGHHTPMLFTSPTAAGRRVCRRTSRPARLQKKKPASRICRMVGCTKGIRSRGLCKAHGGGRRCTTPGCEISDQGGGHCIAHGGGRRCSVGGCQKSAQSKGLCKLHGGARLCRLPDCHKNGQIKGLCRLHYSLTAAAKASLGAKTSTESTATTAAIKVESSTSRSPSYFEMRV